MDSRSRVALALLVARVAWLWGQTMGEPEDEDELYMYNLRRKYLEKQQLSEKQQRKRDNLL